MEHSVINIYCVAMNQLTGIQNLNKASFLNETLQYVLQSFQRLEKSWKPGK